ncbi:hypothetical protein TYRP_001567, partial [Tyrophagus putrescentiae]
FGQRLTLTTLGHCERPPTRAPLAPLAKPESVDVHNAQVSSDLAALGCGLLLFCTVVLSLIFFKIKILVKKLNQLSNGSPWRHLAHQKTPAASDLARSAREALVGGLGDPRQPRTRAAAAVAARTAARAHRLSRQQCSCCDSNTRLRTTAKAAQYQPKQKSTFQTFWRTAGKGFPPPWAMLPPYSLCFLTALQPRPKTVAASGQSLSQHSCRDSDTRARGSQSQRRIATDNVPNFLGFLMVKWTAVIIPLALATAAYLFYSRHQGSAASTASRNENLPGDKDDKLLHLTAQDIAVLRRNQEKVKREKEAQNSMISKPIFSGLPPPPVDGVNCRWVCDNITTTSTEDHKVIEEETEEQVEELEETQKSTEFVEKTTLKSAEKNVKVEYEYEKEWNFEQKVETSTVEIVSSTPAPETKKVDLQMEKKITFDKNKEEEEEEEEHSSPDHALPNIDSKNNFTSSSFFFNSRREEQTTQKMKVITTTSQTPEIPLTTEAQKFVKTEFEEEKEFNFENYEETTKGKNEGSTEEISKITESYSESTLGSPTSTTKKPAEKTLVVTDNKEEFTDFEEEEKEKVNTEKTVEVPSNTPSISTTTKPSLEKLNYEAEKEFNFESQDDETTATQEEELITTSTSPPPTVPELPIYTSPSTEKPIPISSTTTKPSLEKLNFETKNEVNFDQDETQQKQEEQIKTSSSPKLPAFTSTTKQAIKTSTSTTRKPSVERLNYVDENEQTFEEQDEQITSSSNTPPKLPIFTPSTKKSIEISTTTTTTSKPEFKKLDFESENEMNFDQDETQKPSEPIKTSKSPVFASTTKRSSISPSTTPKPAFKNVNFETGKPFNFEQYETQKPEEQIIRTSSPKLPTFFPTTEKSIKSPSTTTSKPFFKNVHFETGKPFNFEQYETQKPEEQIRTSSPKVPKLPTFTSTTKKPITKSPSTTAKPSLEKLNYNSENEMNFEDNKHKEQIITTSSSKSPKQTTTKQSSTKSTTSKIEKLNYETENEINFEQEKTTKQKEQIKSTSAKLPIFTTEHSTFKTSTTPKSAFEKLDYNTENEMTFEQDENVQKQEQQTETSSSKVSHFTTSTVEKLSTTSTTPKPSLVEKLNYNTENEMNFEQDENTQKNEKQVETSSHKLPIFTPSTEKPIPSPSSTTNLFEKLDFESDQEFDFEQDEAQKQEKQIETASSKVPIFTVSTEQSSKVSTTAKPSFKNTNFELEKKDNFKQDETQKQEQQTTAFTTKKSIKKSSTTTTQQSLEKLNYNTENEMTFEQNENVQKQEKQARTSSSKAQNLPISTEQPLYLSPTTSKSPFEKLNYESENEMNFEQDETQKQKSTSSSSKTPKLPTTTKKSGTKSTTTSKSSLEKLDYNTQNEMTFGQEESIQKQKQLTETSSQKVPKLPIFPPITEKSITESPSTTTELFQKLNYESDQEFNFAEEGGEKRGKSKVDENSSSTIKQSELNKVDSKTIDQKSKENIFEKTKNQEKQSSVKGKTAQNLVSGEEKSSAFKEKSSTSKVKTIKSTTTTKATEPPQNQAFKKLDYQSDDSYNFETETAKNNNNNNPAVENRSNVNVKTEASTTATAASSSSTNNSNRKSANQQVNVQQSIENHSDLFHQAIDVTGDGAKNTKKKMKKKVVVANKLPSQAKSYSNAFNNFKQRVQTASTADTSSKKAAAVNSAQAIKYESGENFKNFGERSQFFRGSAAAATTAKSAAESFSGSGSKVKNGTFSFSKKVVNSENSGGAGKSSKTFSGSSVGTSELTGVNRKLIQEKSDPRRRKLTVVKTHQTSRKVDRGQVTSNLAVQRYDLKTTLSRISDVT